MKHSLLQKNKYLIADALSLFKQLPLAIRQSNCETYYPELERKPYYVRVIDNLKWLIRWQEANPFYTLYGLDIKGKDNWRDYCDASHFMRENYLLNGSLKKNPQTNILRNKLEFYKYMIKNGIPTPQVYGVINNGCLIDVNVGGGTRIKQINLSSVYKRC